MSIFSKLFLKGRDRNDYRRLYERVVTIGRDPDWYRKGKVPDTLDGRFDMIASVLAILLLRIEREGRSMSEASALIAELFIEDMDGSVRQMGIGDLMVGKHVGRMMGALGGRIAAFRSATEDGTGFEGPVRRNIFHNSPASEAALNYVAGRLETFRSQLERMHIDDILTGKVEHP